MERWNGGMDFFLLILFAYLCTNYCQEYITLKHRSTIPYIGSRNKNWLGRVATVHVAIAAVCQPSSLQAHQEWQQVTDKLFWWDYF